jgi:hypothetical protein
MVKGSAGQSDTEVRVSMMPSMLKRESINSVHPETMIKP